MANVVLAALAPLQVTLTAPAHDKGRLKVDVEVLRSAGTGPSGDSQVTRTLTLEPGGQGRFQLSLGEGIFRLEARAPGYWSPPTLIRLPEDHPAVVLRLWRTAPIAISVDVAKGAERPARLQIHFRGAPDDPAAERPPEGTRTCLIEGDRATCEVPLGRLDLRIEAKGFVPVYLWSYPPTPERRHLLGPVHLRPGGSIAGFVRTEEGKPVLDAGVEALTPSGHRIGSRKPTGGGRTPGDIDQARHPLQARTNERGFFQIPGLEAGEYQVGARSGERAALASVRVEPGAETRLREFLILEPPLALEVTVDPPTPPGGEGWSLRLLRVEPFPGLVHRVAVPASGSITLAPVGKGRYSIEVWRGTERWFVHMVSIELAPGPVVIRLPIVQVRGELTLGRKPLSGQVVFGGRGGPQEIPMEADAEGRFAGVLPNAGDWSVGIEAESPPIHRRLRRVKVRAEEGGEASVRIDLPDTSVSGRVVDERGAGIEGALVNATPRSADDRFFQARTAADGLFTLHGLAEGSLTLVAQDHGRSSEVVTIRIEKDRAQAVTLVLRSEVRVKGRVRSTSGTPVPGALLLAFPWGVPSTGSPYYNSDIQGEFEFKLPPGTREISVFFWADGHAQESVRVPVPEGPLTLTLEPAGGTLVIDFGRELDLLNEVELVPVVVHGGAHAPAARLYMDVLRRGVLSGAPPTFVLSGVTLPQMAAGDYLLCIQSTDALRANLPVQGPCERGTLTAGGELHLKLPGGAGQH